MTQEELREILDKHNKWLNEEKGGECADFSGVSLHSISLRGINLSHANFSYTNLCHANLNYANLSHANFSHANLSHANFRHADFSYTNLSYANLSYSDFRYSELVGADLKRARYDNTILKTQCPEKGKFIAWKKLKGDAIAKLLIPEEAKRSSATSRKCRASKARVLAIYDKDGKKIDEGVSEYHAGFFYRVGETVYPDDWNEDRWDGCSNGIHFFMTRKEAEEY